MSQFGSGPVQRIVGSSGPQLKLKLPVKVRARFLLKHDEEFSPNNAQQMVRRAFSQMGGIKTTLKLFNIGFQLGSDSLLASMPIEFIKYQRVLALVPLKDNQRCLAVCTSNKDQRTVTVLQMKDEAAVSEASRIIDAGRSTVNDMDAAIMSNLSLNRRKSANWELSCARPAQQQQEQSEDVLLVAAAPGLFDKKPFIGDITTPPDAPQQMALEKVVDEGQGSSILVSTTEEMLEDQNDQMFVQVHQHRTEQLDQQEESEVDDMEAFAIFESVDGPPTLLNEVGVYIKESRLKRKQHWEQQQRQQQLEDEGQYQAFARVGGVWNNGWNETIETQVSGSSPADQGQRQQLVVRQVRSRQSSGQRPTNGGLVH